jgi:hypothetical protein
VWVGQLVAINRLLLQAKALHAIQQGCLAVVKDVGMVGVRGKMSSG